MNRLLRQCANSEQRRSDVWFVNTWVNANADFIIYAFISGAVFLQQWQLTEPLAAGFFWISFLSFFMGAALTQSRYRDYDLRGLLIQISIALMGVGLQVYLIIFHWETLVSIDDALREFRGKLLGNFLGSQTHKVFGWVIWMFLTSLYIRRKLLRGFLLYKVVRRSRGTLY